MKKLKSQNGAIAIIVLVSVLFLTMFLISSYMVISNKLKTQKDVIDQTRQIYENYDLAEIYNSFFNNGVIPIYSNDEYLAIGKNERVIIPELGGKYYDFTDSSNYILMNDLYIKENELPEDWIPPEEFFKSNENKGKMDYNGNNVTVSLSNGTSYVINGNGLLKEQNLLVGKNLLDLNAVEKNQYINGNKLTAYNGWDTSDYMDISEYNKIVIVSDITSFGNYYNALYDENKEFIRNIKIEKTVINNEKLGDVEISMFILNFNQNEKYLRISDSESNLKHIKVYPANSDLNNILKVSLDPYDHYQFDKNLLNDNFINDTYINITDGKQISYTGWKSTDYINVEEYEKLMIYGGITSYNAMYDSEKNFIKSLNTSTRFNVSLGNYIVVDIPENVSYIRLSGTDFKNKRICPVSQDYDDIYHNRIDSSAIGSNIVGSLIKNTYIDNTNGNEIEYNNWDSTDFLDISNYKGIVIKKHSDKYNACYDSSKNAIRNGIAFSNNGYIENDVLGRIGANINYLMFNGDNQYVRLSNLTNKMEGLEIYPILDIDGFIQFEIK